jgi:hypothetical protein
MTNILFHVSPSQRHSYAVVIVNRDTIITEDARSKVTGSERFAEGGNHEAH